MWHRGAAWSSGSSAHCSRAVQKGNGTRRARAGPQEGRCWRSVPAERGAGNGGTGRAAGMPGRASWWQAIWYTEMVLCRLWLNLSVVCSVTKQIGRLLDSWSSLNLRAKPTFPISALWHSSCFSKFLSICTSINQAVCFADSWILFIGQLKQITTRDKKPQRSCKECWIFRKPYLQCGKKPQEPGSIWNFVWHFITLGL